MIAVLGTGLLGSNFTRVLFLLGVSVFVWNRTFERAKALEADAAQAVAGASRVHIVVSDDAAVEGVIAAARFAPGTLVIDHSTTSTAGAKARTARAEITYIHAPVFMGPQSALEGTGLMLISGDPQRIERVKPLLAPMTGKLIDLGERVDAAAAFKLMGNTFLMGFTAAIGDLLGLGKALGFSAAEALTLFEHFNPGAMPGQRSKRMASG